MQDHAREVARAILARWGCQPAPPAEGADCPACEGVPKPGNQPCAVCGRSASPVEGEVAEMAWWLRSLEDASVWFESGSPEALKLTRAADLLERHPTPVPVAIPGEEYHREPASVAPEATEQAQPLWKVMRTAYDCSTAPSGSTGDWIEQDGFAAEIRAVAEWLVPEEEPLPDSVHGGNRFARQAERQRLRALLATEADRAERGDVQ